MASMVNVELDGAPYKKVAIKTTPTMSLKSIADQAIEKLKLPDPPSTYGLKHGKNTMDLSLSVRFANLAARAKLTLVKCGTPTATTAAVVSIALQVDDGTRIMGQFSPSVTFWDILTFFENQSDGTLNLTQRAEVPAKEKQGNLLNAILELAKKNTPVYMMPVCLFVNKEYCTFQELKTTTLASAGLTSGNAVIRLLYRYTDRTLAQARSEADAVFAAKAENATMKPIVPATPSTSMPPSVSSSSTTTAEPNKPPAQPLIQPPAVSAGSNLPSSTTATNAPPTQLVDSVPMEVDTPPAPPTPVAVNAITPQATSTLAINGVPSRPTTAASLPAETAESAELSGTLDPNVKYFRPPPEDIIGPGRIELPDSFYELTPAELKMLLATAKSRRIAEETRVLQTRAMREREAELRSQKWPKTMIRVRFPDRTTLQAQFFSSEKLSALYGIVRQSLSTPQREFSLHIAPPMKVLSDQELTFWKAGLPPMSLVYFTWKDGNTTIGGPLLSAECISNLQAYPLPKDTTTTSSSSAAAPMDVDNKVLAQSPSLGWPDSEQQVWGAVPVTHQPTGLGTSNGAGNTLGSQPIAQRYGVGQDGDGEEDGDSRPSTGRRQDGEQPKRIPRWLKFPGKK